MILYMSCQRDSTSHEVNKPHGKENIECFLVAESKTKNLKLFQKKCLTNSKPRDIINEFTSRE